MHRRAGLLLSPCPSAYSDLAGMFLLQRCSSLLQLLSSPLAHAQLRAPWWSRTCSLGFAGALRVQLSRFPLPPRHQLGFSPLPPSLFSAYFLCSFILRVPPSVCSRAAALLWFGSAQRRSFSLRRACRHGRGSPSFPASATIPPWSFLVALALSPRSSRGAHPSVSAWIRRRFRLPGGRARPSRGTVTGSKF